MKKKNTISRRQFLSYSAMAGAIGAMGVSPMLMSCSDDKKKGPKALKQPGEYYIPALPDKAPDGKPLKAAVIGCGGRGSGAANNFLNAADNVTIVALADVFPDRLNNLRNNLKKRNVEIADDMCFVGFDAYKKAIDSGVDVIINCTPPVFTPLHFQYATEKGVNSFLEKPIAVDADGYRMIMATAKQAQAKGLSVVTGTQRHHQRSYVAAYQKVMEGMIGEITGGCVYWNQNRLWFKSRQDGWSDMEWMIRDWVNWKWLSGDHIVEQHVHNIDVFTWFSGLKPVKATGVGSRQRRVTGDQYDNFMVDFEFENGIHLQSFCRQIDGCSNNISEQIHGTEGICYLKGNEPYIVNREGEKIWEYDHEAAQEVFEQHDPYVLEHVDLISHIRSGDPINEAEETALSVLAGVMGREAAYTGKTITWDEASALNQKFLPENPQIGPMDMSKYTVPVPGTEKK